MDVINLEVQLFLTSVLWGMVLVVVYDCLRIFRRVIKHNKLWAGVEDILYWIVSAVLIFRIMYRINDGSIRGFAIAGVLIGMTLYHYSISEFVVHSMTWAIYKGIQVGEKVFRVIMKPIVWLARHFRWLLEFFIKLFGRPNRFLGKALKKRWKQVKIALVKK